MASKRTRQRPDPSNFSGDVLDSAYKAAERAVERDAEVLDQMRSRANILLAALAVGGAVIGGILSNSTHWPPPFRVVVPFAVAIVSCIFILWPARDHGNLTVAANPEKEHLGFVGRILKPWVELFRALGRNQRLWKTSFNKRDLEHADEKAARSASPQETIKQVLLARLYAAHLRNDGTLSRRADLLRLATLALFVFVITLGIWLRSPIRTADEHPSPTPTPTVKVNVIVTVTVTVSPTTVSPPTEPGRG